MNKLITISLVAVFAASCAHNLVTKSRIPASVEEFCQPNQLYTNYVYTALQVGDVLGFENDSPIEIKGDLQSGRSHEFASYALDGNGQSKGLSSRLEFVIPAGSKIVIAPGSQLKVSAISTLDSVPVYKLKSASGRSYTLTCFRGGNSDYRPEDIVATTCSRRDLMKSPHRQSIFSLYGDLPPATICGQLKAEPAGIQQNGAPDLRLINL